MTSTSEQIVPYVHHNFQALVVCVLPMNPFADRLYHEVDLVLAPAGRGCDAVALILRSDTATDLLGDPQRQRTT